MAKTPLGRLDRSAFGMLELPRLEAGVLAGFGALGDLTGTTSDAMAQPGHVLVIRPGQARFRDAAEGLDQALAFKITSCDLERCHHRL
ncbi:MAG TPA: hypothetical protein VJQ58_09230 [Burkholderiales bacterium]|nr:hypothetical protein [Burkholderiales bacterium]